MWTAKETITLTVCLTLLACFGMYSISSCDDRIRLHNLEIQKQNAIIAEQNAIRDAIRDATKYESDRYANENLLNLLRESLLQTNNVDVTSEINNQPENY